MKTNKAKLDARLDEMKRAIPKLKKENQALAKEFCDMIYGGIRFTGNVETKLIKLLAKRKKQLHEVFEGDRAELIPFLFGHNKENQKLFEKLWNRLPVYAFQVGFNRRSFRTRKRTLLYLAKGVGLISSLFKAIETGCTLETYFDHGVKARSAAMRGKNIQESPEGEAWSQVDVFFVCQWIALALDENDSFVKERIKDIIYGDNSAGMLTHEIVRGILMSRNAEAHKMLGDLLLAAKLQEGLRQSILEACDECSVEGFEYMMNLILDNNLERFSSIVRAMGTWMGLNSNEMRPKAIRKALEISGRLVDDPQKADALLDGNDALELYVALWGIALREIDDVRKPLLTFVKSGQKYKRLAALHFMRQADDRAVDKDVVFELLENDDLEIWEKITWTVRSLLDHEMSCRHAESRLKIMVDQDKTEDDEEAEMFDDDDDGMIDPSLGRLDDGEVRRLFDRLYALAEATPKKETRFEPNVFQEEIRRISASQFVIAMLPAAIILGRQDGDVQKLAELLPKADSYVKGEMVQKTLTFENPTHRPILVDIFCDPHLGWYRSNVTEKFKSASLTSKEYETLEAALRFKDATLRVDLIKLLLQRTPEGLQESIQRLLVAKEEPKRLAGLDLIGQAEKLAKKDKRYADVVATCKEKALASASSAKKKGTKQSAAENILVQNISAKQTAEYSRDNGYGLCDPQGAASLPLPKKSKTILAELLAKGLPRFEKIFDGLSNLLHEHRDYEYTGYYYYGEERQDVILGSSTWFSPTRSIEERKALRNGNPDILPDDLPLAEVWIEFMSKNKITPKDFLLLHLLAEGSSSSYRESFKDYCTGKGEYKEFAEHYVPWFNTVCWPYKTLEKFRDRYHKIPHLSLVVGLLNVFLDAVPEEEKADLYLDLLSGIYYATPKHIFTQPCSISRGYRGEQYIHTAFNCWQVDFLPKILGACAALSDEVRFEERSRLLYAFYQATEFEHELAPGAKALQKQLEAGLIDETEFYRELLVRANRENLMSEATGGRHYRWKFGEQKKAEFPSIEKLLPKAFDRILEIELKRGDSETEVSKLARRIGHFEGIRYFASIVRAMDKTPFVRGYSYSDVESRSIVFCSLLKACEPEEGADSKLFKDIPEQRLLEAAMYAPQWIDLVQEYLGWKGLTSACWYFHAHINESMSETKESIIARYSPITAQRFKDGAFDIDWFNDAHATLGDKRFQMVYDAAKYITSGGNHRRAQIFADALRGKLKIDEIRKSVVEKRNKDNLLAYSLLPLKKGKAGEKEQLERYAFIQNFLKESKKFGQQRKESEGKVCEIALENLARAAGYEDVNRFIWAMETEKMKEYAKYFNSEKIEGFELSIIVDEFGKPRIRSLKEDGTELKDVPTKLKKHAYVAELKDAVKIFRDQFRSVRENFEKAMEHETEFTAEELGNLSQNPVIRPIIEKLVYRCGKTFGFFSEGQLIYVDAKDAKKKLKPGDRLIIAHPSHLFEAKVWKAFQKIVFEREIVQPFKQVFRELYLPNADEKKAKTSSNRYAGHQIQPNKTVALLKGRNWTIDPDFGFQKVFYKLDVVIRLYCYADWFTPSDIEPPTIEKIEFVDRKTFETIPLEKIPPVIFSEIMRDLDLVVSVAHVGGVDPEASLSTVEMRAAIMEETVKLLKLKNVTFKKSHAMIKGSLCEYTVHLGSGEVQMMAGGSLTILPVHSQRRGRLFLPFIDDDPKTAEIMSKTILLAEDEKIKDPTILAAIGR